MRYGFGIDVGGTTVKLAFFDEHAALLDKWEIPTVTDNSGSSILPDIAQSVKAYLQTHQIPLSQVMGIGIGVPGPVDDNGNVNCCENLGWGVFNIHDTLHELTGLPVKSGNDANLAALGEARKGGGAGCSNMILVTLGTGVGGGILVDGKPYNGAHGSAGEIGHIPVNPDETEPCGCGKFGCAEQYCSATGAVRLARRTLAGSDKSSVLRNIPSLECKHVFEAAEQGDLLAIEILDRFYDYLGRFLAAVCCVLDPERVVIGGGVSRAGQPLLEGAKCSFRKYAFHATQGVKFSLAVLGNDAGVCGAFQLILEHLNL